MNMCCPAVSKRCERFGPHSAKIATVALCSFVARSPVLSSVSLLSLVPFRSGRRGVTLLLCSIVSLRAAGSEELDGALMSEEDHEESTEDVVALVADLAAACATKSTLETHAALTQAASALQSAAAGQANKRAICEAGAIPLLLRALQTASQIDPSGAAEIAGALQNILRGNKPGKDTVHRSNAIPLLMDILKSAPSEAASEALEVLRELTSDHADICEEVCDVKGVTAIVELLDDAKVASRDTKLATETLLNISRSGRKACKVIGQQNVLPCLLDIVSSSPSPYVKTMALQLTERLASDPTHHQAMVDADVVTMLLDVLEACSLAIGEGINGCLACDTLQSIVHTSNDALSVDEIQRLIQIMHAANQSSLRPTVAGNRAGRFNTEQDAIVDKQQLVLRTRVLLMTSLGAEEDDGGSLDAPDGGASSEASPVSTGAKRTSPSGKRTSSSPIPARRMSSFIRRGSRGSIAGDPSGLSAAERGMLAAAHQLFRSGYTLDELRGALGEGFERLKRISERALATSVSLGDSIAVYRVLPLARALLVQPDTLLAAEELMSTKPLDRRSLAQEEAMVAKLFPSSPHGSKWLLARRRSSLSRGGAHADSRRQSGASRLASIVGAAIHDARLSIGGGERSRGNTARLASMIAPPQGLSGRLLQVEE